jgi:hypothetical protein
MAPYMTPPRYSSDPSSPKLNNDPLLTGSPVMKTKSIPSDGTVGGFPVKFLDMVVCPELPSDVDKLQGIYAVCVEEGGGVILCLIIIIITTIIIIIYLTANGLLPGGSGYNART